MPSRSIRAAALVLCCTPIISCAHSAGKAKSLAKAKTAIPANQGKKQRGIASIYNDSRTASGEAYCPAAMCAAHPTLPMGSMVRVTSVRTGRSAVVRINDRGPFAKGRIIDLTPAAAAKIGFARSAGITNVELAVVEPPAAPKG